MQLKVNNSTGFNRQVWLTDKSDYTFAYGTNHKEADSECNIYVYGLKHINTKLKKNRLILIVYKLVPYIK